MPGDFFQSLVWRYGFSKSGRRRRGAAKRRDLYRFDARFELLEPRLVLATVVLDVSTVNDDFFGDTPGLSLREAIYTAHNDVNPDDDVVINLQGGATYTITRPTVTSGIQTEDDPALDPAWGDFDIRRDMVINVTPGSGPATIDANGLGRAFQISGGATVSIVGVQIVFGQAPLMGGVAHGGAIHISGNSHVSLVDLSLNQNIAQGRIARGGAVYVDNPEGSVDVVRGGYFSNGALGTVETTPGDVSGGAFHVERGHVSFQDAHLLVNVARAASASGSGNITGGRALGGAIAIGQGTVQLNGTEVDQNRAEGGKGSNNSGTAGAGGAALGGAVYVGAEGHLVTADTAFTSNRAEAGDGGNSSGFVGGAGGSASGGAIFLEGGGEAAIVGGRLENSHAVGGDGGGGQDGGGNGGAARGGAVGVADGSQANPPQLRFTDVALVENLAIGGRGGNTTEDGPAGHGGAALGGAIYSTAGDIRLENAPFVENSAEGGAGGNVMRGRAGNGGLGSGGAIYLGGSAQLAFLSTLSIIGPTEDPELIDSTGLMFGNLALGGHGGHKLHAGSGSNDDAGDGGRAQGGAIAAVTNTPIHISDVAMFNNGALAGNGGHGNVFADQGGAGTAGGDAGEARGGALYTETSTTLEDVAFFGNTAAGGRLESTPQEGAFAGGQAGVGSNSQGLRGGAGGRAAGGAVFIGAGDLIVQRSGFSGNQALGSNGGGGGTALNNNNDSQGKDGGHGGHGGHALGGAIRAETSGQLNIGASLFAGNLALAGRGGTAGLGANGVRNGGDGGHGGHGGVAAGGAISVHPVSNPGTPTSVMVHETLIVANKAIAGDGGFAGNGGAGSLETGGSAGSGGNGGLAVGGGVDLNTVHAQISFTTIEQNVVSSGWGAGGGHAGSGAWYGAIDTVGRGGHGGDALGGGLAIQNGDLAIHTSTVVQNEVFAGFGGHGAWGGHGHFGGGHGTQGGNSGNARGGGIYHNGPQDRLYVHQATVAKNRLFVGNGGFGGKGGLRMDGPFLDSDVPTHYEVNPFSQVPVLSGAASVLMPEIGYLSEPPAIISIPSLHGGFDDPNLTVVGLDALSLDSIGSLSLAVAIPIITAGISASAIATATATSVVSFTGGGVALTGIGAGPAVPSVAGLSGAGFALTFGAFSVGGAILSIGAVVATRAIWAGIESGNWEASFAWSLGAPGEVSGVAINILLSGVFPNEDDDPPEPFGDGNNGIVGADGVAEGTNIWGAARLGRTLVADGEAIQRTRARVVAAPSVAANAYWISENVSDLDLADVAGGNYERTALNLIGAVDSGFESDLHGTTAEPLDARLDEHTRYNGGLTPTLRLLPLSPARGLWPNSSIVLSQNHYEWDFFYDIGAWGHGFNQPPTALDDSFTTAAGENALFSPEQLLANDFDVDGDPLHVSGNNVDGTAENGTLVKQTIMHLDGSISTTFIYTPNPGFAGIETFTYLLTDGEFADTGTITIEVLPPPPLEVVDVRLSGSDWNLANPALLDPISVVGGSATPLPWANLNKLEVKFSDDVNLASSSLVLAGVNVPDYMSSGSGVSFDYNPTTFTATWTFAAPLGIDRLLLNLDGESGDAHPVSAVSDGRLLAEGDLALDFSILPGDVNGNGSVSVTDLVTIAQNAIAGGGGTFPANYDRRLDINGDGAIDIADLVFTSSRVTQQLPAGTPQLPAGGAGNAPAAAELIPLSGLAASVVRPLGSFAHTAPSPSAWRRTANRAFQDGDVLDLVLADWHRDRVLRAEGHPQSSFGGGESVEYDHPNAIDMSLAEFDGGSARLGALPHPFDLFSA